MKFDRYRYQGKISYGVLDGTTVREIDGGLFGDRRTTGLAVELDSVELLWPCEPSKLLAVGLNYKSHLGNQPPPANPEIFFKPPSALLAPGGEIKIPLGAGDVHYEGELVVVIGKTAKHVPREAAMDFVWVVGTDLVGAGARSPWHNAFCRLHLHQAPPRWRQSCRWPAGPVYRADQGRPQYEADRIG